MPVQALIVIDEYPPSISGHDRGRRAPIEQIVDSDGQSLNVGVADRKRGVIQQKRAMVTSFARWVRQRRVDVTKIDEAAVGAFLVHLRRRRISIGNRHCTLTAFLEHLRAEGAPCSVEAFGEAASPRLSNGLQPVQSSEATTPRQQAPTDIFAAQTLTIRAFSVIYLDCHP